MAELFIRVFLSEAGPLGPGKVQLLELIGQTGSIRSAAVAMKMSYRRAWLLVQETEKIFGAPVIETKTGGAKGGGAALTPLGRKIIQHFRAIESHAAIAARADLAALHKLKKPG